MIIVGKPYPGQREPSCIHDYHQPAGMCTECSKRPEVIEWHRLSREIAEARVALGSLV
jgi:hypothetical protein